MLLRLDLDLDLNLDLDWFGLALLLPLAIATIKIAANQRNVSLLHICCYFANICKNIPWHPSLNLSTFYIQFNRIIYIPEWALMLVNDLHSSCYWVFYITHVWHNLNLKSVWKLCSSRSSISSIFHFCLFCKSHACQCSHVRLILLLISFSGKKCTVSFSYYHLGCVFLLTQPDTHICIM